MNGTLQVNMFLISPEECQLVGNEFYCIFIAQMIKQVCLESKHCRNGIKSDFVLLPRKVANEFCNDIVPSKLDSPLKNSPYLTLHSGFNRWFSLYYFHL